MNENVREGEGMPVIMSVLTSKRRQNRREEGREKGGHTKKKLIIGGGQRCPADRQTKSVSQEHAAITYISDPFFFVAVCC